MNETHSLVETRRCRVLRRLPDRLLQKPMGGRVVQLDRTDTAEVVHVTSNLVVVRRFGECAFRDQFVGLVVKIIVQIVAQQKIHDGCLAILVPP